MPVVLDMKQLELPDYNELSQLLFQTKRQLIPSQVHGLICGMLCGEESHVEPNWDLITGGFVVGLRNEAAKQLKETLNHLWTVSKEALQNLEFHFELLLPDDDEQLAERAEALTLWCQGFLTGMKNANCMIAADEQPELKEAVNDLIDIAQMNYEDVVDSDEDEVAYQELIEFVRVAAMLIYADKKALDKAKATQVNSDHH